MTENWSQSHTEVCERQVHGPQIVQGAPPAPPPPMEKSQYIFRFFKMMQMECLKIGLNHTGKNPSVQFVIFLKIFCGLVYCKILVPLSNLCFSVVQFTFSVIQKIIKILQIVFSVLHKIPQII